MPMGSRIPSWLSMMYLRQHVQDLLVGGDGHRLGRIDHPLDVALHHLLVLDGDDAVRIEAAHVAAGDAAYTEWISQPAISSAFHRALIDCTVDSMFTTTPFFNPREGWLPMPMISGRRRT
jgi:hypothetical protein